MRKSPAKIPRAELRDGLIMCLEVASARLEAALTVGGSPQAAIIFSFALEEFGKAALLQMAIEGGEDPAIVSGFYDHETKLEAAEHLIPPEYLLLHPGPGFEFNPGD